VVVNNPITGIKCQHVFLPMVINATDNPPPEEPEEEPEAEPATFIETPLSGVCERPVANGMMMVVVEPIQQSEAYLPGDTVVTSGTISVRLGPGTNYATIATIEDDTTGQVAAHPNELEGILAKGAYWWLVDFEDADGWVAEGDIVPPAAYLRSRLKNLPVMWKPDANQEE
jgi:hypothetical protein